MKKLFCLLLAVCLLAPLLPMGARAAAEDLTPYVKVLEDAMKTDADAERYGEAMFFDLDASAPRELILVRCPEDAAHAVLEVWTIRSGEAVRILHTPLVVLAGGNTGSAHVGEYHGRPILVAESRSPEVGDTTVTVTGGFKRFVMENGRVDIDESAFYTEVIDISPNAKSDPILYDKSDAIIQGVWHPYVDYLDWRHSCVLLATNAGFTGTDWDDDAEPFKVARDYCLTGFWDIPAGKWFTESVLWAAERGITNGTSPDRFSPNESCTRAQFVTFLWRSEGQPKAKTNSTFADVPQTQYYFPSVSWAVGEGITNGVSATKFDPKGTLTRAQVVTFLWRLAGSPKTRGVTPFTDLKPGAYYLDAVAWATSTGVTNGMTDTTFAPDAPCTRAQAVTFLMREAHL
ncbi:MAG: S-layer homology domain-containing protein [Oscillospiraceae bacterium]|nr:S-layer homology domain-containing protein [Oscillospiraceae bacterium]